MTQVWHLLTGEYLPDPGGVADYSALVAAGLVQQGQQVHVWASSPADRDRAAVEPDGANPQAVHVHRWPEGWSATGLERLDRALAKFPAPRRLLVEYTPNAWGMRGMNLGFGRWLEARRDQGDEVWTMVHEPFYPFRLWDKPTRWLLAAVQRRIIRRVLAASSRVFISNLGFDAYLRPYAARGKVFEWLPVPGNIPFIHDPAEVAALRAKLFGDSPVIGSFGTYGPAIRGPLERLLPSVLQASDARCLLLGREGDKLAADLAGRFPALAGRITAFGGMPHRDLSLHLQTIDVMLQPYPDGVSARRGSVMAGLEHARSIVTNVGVLTEPIWSESAAVRLLPVGGFAGMEQAARELLASVEMRQALSAKAKELYEARFSVARTVEGMLRPPH